MDKYWPVANNNIKAEVKEEPLEAEADLEWERAAEEEILAANEGYLESPGPESARERPRRRKNKPKSYKEDYDSDRDIDDPGEEEEGSLFDEYPDDPDFDDDQSEGSFSPLLYDSEDSVMDEDSNLDLSLVKEELDSIEDEDDGEVVTRADGILAASKECKIVEIGGHKVETYGDYSKCPKCEKNIKSTFIIRHIKLHDQPSTTMNCPYQDCSTSFTR